MKRIPSTNKDSTRQKPVSAAVSTKISLIREATRITLDQYSKTFEDLARYDRTEAAHG